LSSSGKAQVPASSTLTRRFRLFDICDLAHLVILTARTFSELEETLKDVESQLVMSHNSEYTSISSGCKQFLHYIMKEGIPGNDFSVVKQHLVTNGCEFLRKANNGRDRIVTQAVQFIRDGAVYLSHS
jgi:translation initiation factor 2B subunit (eIF-2B alpha/beta/delta family)